MGMLMMSLLAAPAAQADPPPPPVVSVPATMVFIVEKSAQPVHFEGTVTGPVGPADRVQVTNVTANPADPPQRCDIQLGGMTNWSCNNVAIEAIGEHEMHVRWIAPNAPFGELSAPTVIILQVVPDSSLPHSPVPPEPKSDSAADSKTPTQKSTPTRASVTSPSHLVSLPDPVMSLIGLFGNDGPSPRQMLDGVILAVTTALVFTGS